MRAVVGLVALLVLGFVVSMKSYVNAEANGSCLIPPLVRVTFRVLF